MIVEAEWLTAIAEIVEKLEMKVTAALRKGFGAPECLSIIPLHSKGAKLQLPLQTLLDEYKFAKCRTVAYFQES